MLIFLAVMSALPLSLGEVRSGWKVSLVEASRRSAYSTSRTCGSNLCDRLVKLRIM